MAEGSATSSALYDNSAEPKPLINERSTILGLLIPFVIFQWLCVLLRLWTRQRLRLLGFDDAFVFIAAVFATVGSIYVCRCIENGLGEHFATIGVANIVGFQKKYYVAILTYNVATMFAKLCLLTQYIRMLEKPHPLRKVCWGFLVLTCLWGTAFIAIAIVPCVPISAFWNRGTGHCYGYGSIETEALQRVYIAQNTSNVLLDLIVLGIPLYFYFQKATPSKTRMGIGFLLFIGAGVNLVSIWRLHTVIRTKAATYPVPDPTWYGVKSIVLAAIEVDLASICASVPVFWPMLTQSLNKIFVTQEVHVVHQHRRLSGEEHGEDGDDFELRVSESGASTHHMHSHKGSESSLNLVHAKHGAPGYHSPQISTTKAGPLVAPQNAHYSDKYVVSRVAPLGFNNDVASSEAEIRSHGQEGFRKEQERFGGTLQYQHQQQQQQHIQPQPKSFFED